MTQNTSSAVMQQRAEAHNSLEDFPTPPWATRALIDYVILPMTVPGQLGHWTAREPCCNRGYMALPLVERFRHVIATDIFDYGFAGHEATVDYLWPSRLQEAEWTVANPPFRLAEQFILRSFETPGWLGSAMLVRTSFLEGVERYRNIFAPHKYPPTIVAQFSERVVMHKGVLRDPSKTYWNPNGRDPETRKKTGAWQTPSTATSYCWLVWMRDKPRKPPIWIPPCRKLLERPGDYPINPDEWKEAA